MNTRCPRETYFSLAYCLNYIHRGLLVAFLPWLRVSPSRSSDDNVYYRGSVNGSTDYPTGNTADKELPADFARAQVQVRGKVRFRGNCGTSFSFCKLNFPRPLETCVTFVCEIYLVSLLFLARIIHGLCDWIARSVGRECNGVSCNW